jgi:hypothetical protein
MKEFRVRPGQGVIVADQFGFHSRRYFVEWVEPDVFDRDAHVVDQFGFQELRRVVAVGEFIAVDVAER